LPQDQRPLRILHLTAGSDAGGLSKYIHDLCRAMQHLGHEVAVAGEKGFSHDLFANSPWPWIDVPLKGSPLALASAAKVLDAYIQRHPVDLIHTHYRRCTLVARRLQRRHGMPILYTVHQPRIGLNWFRRLLTDFGDHTHVASVDARDWLIKVGRVAPEHIAIIPHGVDPAKFPLQTLEQQIAARQQLGIDANATVAAFVGRFDTPKNPLWMIQAALACGSMPNTLFVMMGNGPDEPAVRRMIAQHALEARVKLLNYGDPLPVYHAANALFSTSLREGFSLVCAEAMCSGLPVLRTRTGGSAEMILEGVTGRTTAVNAEEFAQAVPAFLADRAALAKMGQAAAAHVRESFTFDRQLQDTLALYRKTIAQP